MEIGMPGLNRSQTVGTSSGLKAIRQKLPLGPAPGGCVEDDENGYHSGGAFTGLMFPALFTFTELTCFETGTLLSVV